MTLDRSILTDFGQKTGRLENIYKMDIRHMHGLCGSWSLHVTAVTEEDKKNFGELFEPTLRSRYDNL